MSGTAMVRKPDGQEPAPPPVVDPQLADQLLARAEAGGVELLGPDGLLSQVARSVLERALAEEMTGHLGYEKHDPAGRGSGNSRNGRAPKTVLTEIGWVDLAVSRDRARSFEPKIVRKGQTRRPAASLRTSPGAEAKPSASDARAFSESMICLGGLVHPRTRGPSRCSAYSVRSNQHAGYLRKRTGPLTLECLWCDR